MYYDEDYVIAETDELAANLAQETVQLLKDVAVEQPDAVMQVIPLLKSGWCLIPSGHQVICVTLRSACGSVEVLGHGPSNLDAFEEVQRKTSNFTKLEKPGVLETQS